MIPNSRQTLIDYCLRNLGIENSFIFNKYYKWMVNILESRVNNIPEGYSENHHIIPESFGGPDDSFNMIRLTAREHFIVHLVMPKCVKGNANKSKMAFALNRLVYGNNREYTYNSKSYEYIKILNQYYSSLRSIKYWSKIEPHERSLMRSGEKNPMFGQTRSQAVKDAVSKANKGNNYRIGKYHTKESIEKMSENRKGITKGFKWFHSLETNEWALLETCPEGWKPGRHPDQGGNPFGKQWYYDPVSKTEKIFFNGEQPENHVPGRANRHNKKWYHNSEQNTEGLFIPSEQPEGYILGRLPR